MLRINSWFKELSTKFSEDFTKFGKGFYYGLLLVESTFKWFHISGFSLYREKYCGISLKALMSNAMSGHLWSPRCWQQGVPHQDRAEGERENSGTQPHRAGAVEAAGPGVATCHVSRVTWHVSRGWCAGGCGPRWNSELWRVFQLDREHQTQERSMWGSQNVLESSR